MMAFLKKLFGRDNGGRPRIRICSECGMPVGDHKEWCSIFRTERERRAMSGNRPSESRAS